MSTQYNGIGNIVYPTSIPIVSSTNTTPIQITATAHGLMTGDSVDITDHTVNLNANASWLVTVTGPNTFTLQGSVGSGVGGATGLVHPITFGQTYPIPSDGDADAAASVDVALEALGDRTASLLFATGAYKLKTLFQSANINADGTAIASGFAQIVTMPSTAWVMASVLGSTPILGVQSSDVLEIAFSATAYAGPDATGLYAEYNLGVSVEPPGIAPAPVHVLGSGQIVPVNASTSTTAPISLRGLWLPNTNGTVKIYVGNRVNTWSNTNPLKWIGEWTLNVKVWSPTFVQQ